ncbi:hypothetical protein [Spirillospora sp. NPDC047279]|uniref:hypothetical protein n=1 Tax=Spirillospora sp. NPDC047279 TaxID=3155478 RepID=UPI0033DAF172
MAERRLTLDTDARVMAWIGPGGVPKVADLDETPPRVHEADGPEGARSVVPGGTAGEFLVVGDGTVVPLRWTAGGVGSGDAIPLPDGAREVGAAGGLIAACTGDALLTYDGRWRERAALPAEPVCMAWQHRRRSLLVLTRDGSFTRFADEAQAARDDAWADPATAVYDEVLGALWLAHPGGDARTLMVRVEPWPPRTIYQAGLGAGVRGLTVAQNGEWLAVRYGGDRPIELYNVSGRRLFRPPPTAGSAGNSGNAASGVAFTYDNRLVTVTEDDRVSFARLPARVDVRTAPAGGEAAANEFFEHGGDLDIETFWEGQMYKASKPRRRPSPAAAGGSR